MGDVSGEVQAAEEDERLVCCALYLVNNLHSLPHLSLGPGTVYLSFKFNLKNYWGIIFFKWQIKAQFELLFSKSL